MSTLAELSEEYRTSAVRLRVGMERIRLEIMQADAAEQTALQDDLRQVKRMLQEVREVGDLARHYYEPGYWRDRKYTV